MLIELYHRMSSYPRKGPEFPSLGNVLWHDLFVVAVFIAPGSLAVAPWSWIVQLTGGPAAAEIPD